MSAAVSLPPVTVRPMRKADLGFIVDTWRNGFASESELCRFDRDVYRRLMARHINALLREPGCLVRIACDPADEDTLLGFALLTGDELHYVYVRQAVAKHGIARSLLDGLIVKTYAFRTASGEGRIRPRERGWSYAPRVYRAREGKIQVEMS